MVSLISDLFSGSGKPAGIGERFDGAQPRTSSGVAKAAAAWPVAAASQRRDMPDKGEHHPCRQAWLLVGGFRFDLLHGSDLLLCLK